MDVELSVQSLIAAIFNDDRFTLFCLAASSVCSSVSSPRVASWLLKISDNRLDAKSGLHNSNWLLTGVLSEIGFGCSFSKQYSMI
jgi:hypothetical protein